MKTSKLVVGIDFSDRSVEAAHWAARYFAPGAELVLVHAISIPEPPPILRSRFPQRELLVPTVREGAEKRLREISLDLNADKIWIEIREGDPTECLTRVAGEFEADIIVAGAHGERPGLHEGLGTTAQLLVRAAPCPVLLVNHANLESPSHILAPVDKSDIAEEALRWAAAVSRRTSAKVTVLHVASSGVASGVMAAAAIVSGAPVVDSLPHTTTQSDYWLDRAVSAGVPRESAIVEVASGDPTQEIASAVDRLGADLIVMGRRGEGRLRRAVLGSVVDGVLRNVSRPVLIVPEPTHLHGPLDGP